MSTQIDAQDQLIAETVAFLRHATPLLELGNCDFVYQTKRFQTADPLQEMLSQMERESPSPSLEGIDPTFRERNYFAFRSLVRSVECKYNCQIIAGKW